MLTGEIGRTFRNLIRAPRLCLAVVATLAAGAGGLFSLYDALVVRKLPVRDPSPLVAIFPANGEALFGISMPTLTAFATAQNVLDGVFGVSQGGAINVEFNGAHVVRPAESVTGECARVLGIEASFGLITPEDAPLRSTIRRTSVVSSSPQSHDLRSFLNILRFSVE